MFSEIPPRKATSMKLALTERMQEGEFNCRVKLFFFTDQKNDTKRATDSHFLSPIKDTSINSSGI